MSSILTNTSAMVALQTLQGINKDLAKTQDMISTGKNVVTAKDDAAVWAISKVMTSDVRSFESISDSLSLSDSTIAVARQASETITDLLTQIREKIVLAQNEVADREKIDTDITELRNQINGVVSAAQFNGVNLINGEQDSPFTVLSSLDRQSDGQVSARQIELNLTGANLSNTAGDAVTAAFDTAPTLGAASIATGGGTTAISAAVFSFVDAASAAVSASFASAAGDTEDADSDFMAVGDVVEVTVAGVDATYTIQTGDTGESVLGGLLDGLTAAGLDSDIVITLDEDEGLLITNNSDEELDWEIAATRGDGGLAGLSSLTITGSDQARADALNDIEDMIDYAIDAAATFGSAQGRIQTQMEFISGLTDALKTGIGALVDTDMEEASAKLQALQVQQQLGVQALSIANQAPQTILALFQ